MKVKIVREESVPAVQAAPLENLLYIREMVMEIRSLAVEVDWQLTYVLDMAAMHTVDLLSGKTKPEKIMSR